MTVRFATIQVARSMAEIKESKLIGPELVQETTDKVVLIKEKLIATRDHQKEIKIDKTLRFVEEPVEIIDREVACSMAEIRESRLIGPELVQDTTDKVVLIKENLKAARDHQKSYADNRPDTNLHVHSEEIKIDKTLRFVEEPVEIIDREVLLNGSDEYAYSVLEWIGWVRLLSFGIDRMGTPTQYWNGSDGYAYLVFGC
nr:putative reverse transcriptase domain-containing protein [Tanacetum cinerariifolium]